MRAGRGWLVVWCSCQLPRCECARVGLDLKHIRVIVLKAASCSQK